MSTPKIHELYNLRGKAALVTGGAMGIGKAIAFRLAEAGAAIAVVDVDMQAAEQTVFDIEQAGGRAVAARCDLSRAGDAVQAVQGTVRAFGRLDVVVNNAGIFPMARAVDVDEAMWDHVLAVNLKGAFFVAQAAAKRMIEQGDGGTIVNISSIDAFHPTGALAHYDASKGGLEMLTKSLAFELAKERIRVNAVAPGAIQTPGAAAVLKLASERTTLEEKKVSMERGTSLESAVLARIPAGRMGVPDDIARAVLFLASPASDYVTGAVLVVDGGYLLS